MRNNNNTHIREMRRLWFLWLRSLKINTSFRQNNRVCLHEVCRSLRTSELKALYLKGFGDESPLDEVCRGKATLKLIMSFIFEAQITVLI